MLMWNGLLGSLKHNKYIILVVTGLKQFWSGEGIPYIYIYIPAYNIIKHRAV